LLGHEPIQLVLGSCVLCLLQTSALLEFAVHEIVLLLDTMQSRSLFLIALSRLVAQLLLHGLFFLATLACSFCDKRL